MWFYFDFDEVDDFIFVCDFEFSVSFVLSSIGGIRDRRVVEVWFLFLGCLWFSGGVGRI